MLHVFSGVGRGAALNLPPTAALVAMDPVPPRERRGAWLQLAHASPRERRGA